MSKMTVSSGVRKIVIVSSVPLAEPVLRNRITPFFQVLLQAGHEVFFVCPKGDGDSDQQQSGVQLKEVTIALGRPRGFVGRAIQEAWSVLLLLRQAKKIQADVWLLTMPSIFFAFLAPLSMRGRKVVLDVRDLTWEYLSENKALHRVSKKIFRTVFRYSVSFFREITVTNPTELEYVRRTGKGSVDPLLVSNGISREQFDKLAGLVGLEVDAVTVAYIGNVGLAQQLETLVEAAEQLPEVTFRVVGEGTDFARIKEFVAEKKIENVLLTGRVSWEGVRENYNMADILYAQLAPEYSGAMPSKLYEYLATGKYIVYGGQGQAVEILAGFNNHQVIPPCDVPALIAVIRAYIKDGKRQGLSQTNREKIRAEYIRENAASKLLECMDRLCV